MIQTLDRALSVLDYLAGRRSAGITEIAAAFQIDKSTASRIMQTFVMHEMAVRDEATRKYSLGVGALRLSDRVMRNNHLIRVAHPHLLKLSRLTGATARLCVLDCNRMRILDQAIGGKVGARLDADPPRISKPFHCSAVGKTFLAYLPREAARALLGERLTSYTENTVADADALFCQFEKIRQIGYATNLAEYADRTYCIAVPVLDRDGFPQYSVGVSGARDFRANPTRFRQTLRCLRTFGDTLAREL